MEHPELDQEIVRNNIVDTNNEIDIKQEPSESGVDNQNVMVQIKIENDIPLGQGLGHDYETQIEIKEEIPMEYDKNQDITDSDPQVSSEIHIENNQIVTKDETDNIDEDMETNVKHEMLISDASVGYDYPNFEDSQSINSNDIAVLGNVETCLQEEIQIKSECHEGIQDQNNFTNMMDDSELVTETHLISNKLINTTSTVTNNHDGLIESYTTNTLVMEILPVPHGDPVPFSKISNPEEILPTPYDSNMSNEDMFQLNSITGNVLSLEQEAYSLLKAKKHHTEGQMYPCPKCTKEYRSPGLLKRHMSIHQSIENRANGVIKGLKTRKANRKKLTESVHKIEIEVPQATLVKVETCDDVVVKQEIKKEGYECTCRKVFQRRSRMETCLRSHSMFTDNDPCHQCTTCLRRFNDKNDLATHRKRSHRKKFHCKFCPTDYNTRKELLKHLQVHQKVQLMEYKVISEVVQGNQKLCCFMCTKSYVELSELKSHIMEDHKSPYSCLHCKNTFGKIIEFGDHMKTYHPDVEGQSVLDVLEAFSLLVKAWKCEDCGLQFHEADKLALHQIEKHSPDIKVDPQFQCADCRRVFINQKGLTSHRRVHHSETIEVVEPAVKGIMCLECRKICKDEDALTSHMRLHSPDRKYPCKFCDFRFSTPEKRKAHAELHTGDMKYVCFICEYQCSSENRLKQHKASVKHLNMKEFLASGNRLEQSTPQDSKDAQCENSDENNSGESGVACDICGDLFSTESEMLEHKQTHPFIEFPNEDKPSRIFFK